MTAKGISKEAFQNGYCDNDLFEDVRDFMQHISQKALQDEPVHIGLWNYLTMMYPCLSKTLYSNKKVRSIMILPSSKQKSLPVQNMFSINR